MYVATHTHIPFRKQIVDDDAYNFGGIIYEQQEDQGNLLEI